MNAALNATDVRRLHVHVTGNYVRNLSFRLAHRSDCLDKTLYPLLIHKHRITTQKCSVCHVFIGRCVFKKKKKTRVGWNNTADFQTLKHWLHVFADGSPPMTSLPQVTRVSSVTSVSACFTTTLRATSWGIFWRILMWTVVPSTECRAQVTDLMLYNTVKYLCISGRNVWEIVYFILKVLSTFPQ